MNKTKRLISTLLVVCLALCWTNIVQASDNILNNNDLLLNAENITYLSDGSYIYQTENKYYYYDLQENETLLLVEKNVQTISLYATTVSHTPKDLTPYWIWWQTDGPYSVSINMSAVNRVLQTAANWTEVSIALGLTAGVLQWAYEAANGNFNVNQTVWEIDDGYHAYNDYGYHRVESYFYSNARCTNLIDTDSFTYRSSW